MVLNPQFEKIAMDLPLLLNSLLYDAPRTLEHHTEVPKKGIYVFYEDNRPLYIGRSNNMRKRLKQHGTPSSTHYSATFAFNIAKKEAVKKGININISRKNLEKNPEFAVLFAKAKKRVRNMSIRVIEIEDQILQTVFEVYAHLALETEEFNDFTTH